MSRKRGTIFTLALLLLAIGYSYASFVHQQPKMFAVAYARASDSDQSPTTPEQRVSKPADQVENVTQNPGWTFIPNKEIAVGNEGADGVESSSGSGPGFKFVESSSPPNNSTIAFVETPKSGQPDLGTTSFTFTPNPEVTVPNYRGGSVTKPVDPVTDSSPPAEARQAKNESSAHAQPPAQNTSLLAGSCAINPGVLDAVKNNTRIPAADLTAAIRRADDLGQGKPREIARVIQLMTGEHVNWRLDRQPRNSRDDVWPLSGPWTGEINGSAFTIRLVQSGEKSLSVNLDGEGEQAEKNAYKEDIDSCIDELKASLRPH